MIEVGEEDTLDQILRHAPAAAMPDHHLIFMP